MWKQCSIDLKKRKENGIRNILSTHSNNVLQTTKWIGSVCVFVCVCRLMLLPVWNIEKPKEVLLRLCSRKGTINQPHPPSARLQSCLCCAEAHVCACLCTVDGSSSRRRCGTRWRWWRASWALPRRPRPTGAPTDRLTGSVALNCPAGWGGSITEAHKHTSKLFELHWLYIHITHLEGSFKWLACAPGCIYRMCGAVGSMLIMGGLVSLVGRNAAVHKPAHTPQDRESLSRWASAA